MLARPSRTPISVGWFATRRREWIRRMARTGCDGPRLENDPEVEAGDIGRGRARIIYHPGGPESGREPVALLRSEIAIWAPIPDALASFRGMSWLTPIMREVVPTSR